MAKVFIYPATSLMLSDLVARYGHTPLGSAVSIREHIQTPGFDSPPLQMTSEDPQKGLKWAAVEVPSGIRGRMSLYGPLVEEAERLNSILKYYLKRSVVEYYNGVPYLEQ